MKYQVGRHANHEHQQHPPLTIAVICNSSSDTAKRQSHTCGAPAWWLCSQHHFSCRPTFASCLTSGTLRSVTLT